MAISEAARADLYTGLAEVLGPERAETLMTQLPRYDPIDVVTIEHLDALETRLNVRFDRLEDRMDGFEERMDGFDDRLGSLNGRMDRLFLTLVAGLFVIVAAMAGVVFASL